MFTKMITGNYKDSRFYILWKLSINSMNETLKKVNDSRVTGLGIIIDWSNGVLVVVILYLVIKIFDKI